MDLRPLHVTIEVAESGDLKFTRQFEAFKLAHELSRRGCEVRVRTVGHRDPRCVRMNRLQIRAVA
jgi:hypothetical protein